MCERDFVDNFEDVWPETGVQPEGRIDDHGSDFILFHSSKPALLSTAGERKIFAPFWDLNLDTPAWGEDKPDEAGKRISRKDAEAQELERQNTVLGNLCALASLREPLSGSPVLEQTGVGDADELLRLHETFAKLLIKFLRGRGGYDFVHRLALVLQFREALEHCFEEGEITAQIFRRRQRPMARNDAGLRGRHSGQRFRRGDHSAEPAAGRIIDEWIPAIEEQIAGVDYIGFLEMHKDVAIGVRRRHRHEPDFVTIKV